MTKPHILQVGPYPDWDQVPLDAAFHMHRYFDAPDKTAFLAEVGPLVRGIATRGELGANAAMIAACPQLEVISVYGVGYDAVDLSAARARGIRVTNTPDVLTNDVADLGVAMMLVQSRGMIGAETWVRDGSWAAKGLYPLQRRVWGKRAGVLGLGRIGHEVARRLAGFDMDIAYSSRGPKEYATGWEFIADPVALAARSDFLFVTLAASAATRHIVGQAVIEALGPQGMLINISRASNIDEEALLAALDSGKLGSAALDVFEGEPKLNPRFLSLPNVLVQPHHASGTFETRQAMGKLANVSTQDLTYENAFLSPSRLKWFSQNQTRQNSKHGRVISGEEGHEVHLFIRRGNKVNGKVNPFIYCGQPKFVDWTGEEPIEVTWDLPVPAPRALWAELGIPEDD